jgi:hypothetical protein
MSKDISDIVHLIKNKCHNSVLIDIIGLIDTNKLIDIIVLKYVI